MREHKIDWNEQADMYSEFAFCELEDTRGFLDALLMGRSGTLLDVCCGPGRASVAAAQMGLQVTGIDSAPRMLEHARANAQAHGVADLCDFRLLDWGHVLPGQNLDKHDVVFASRCAAMMDVEKLSSLANRTVGVQIFANAPSIPMLLSVLFSGCGEDEAPERGLRAGFGGPSAMAAGGSGGPGGHGGMSSGPAPMGAGRRPDGPDAKESIYLKIAGKAFAAGYDPNVRVFPERFRKKFGSEEEALAWIAALKPERAEGNMDRLALNVAPFLNRSGEGVEFRIATKAAIIWWDVEG